MRRVLTSHRDIARVTLGRSQSVRMCADLGLHTLLRGAVLPDRIVALVGDLLALHFGAFALALTPLLFEGGPGERYEFALEVIIRGLASVANDNALPGLLMDAGLRADRMDW